MSQQTPAFDSSDREMATTPREEPRLDLRAVVLRYHEAVYRYAYRLAGNQADAEDLTQQTFLVAQQRLGQVREADKILSWLFTVLKNCYLKDRHRHRRFVSADIEVAIEQVPEPLQREEIDEAELQMALDELSDEFKIVVLMFYFEDCSYKEIATRLDIPIGTVMSRLARGKAHLRRWLTERAATTEGKGRSATIAANLDIRGEPRPQVLRPIRMDR
jgi:RNA polymerase sigma-70 factor (ECF subfamily)